MDKQLRMINGFTLIEMLLVLLIVSVLSFGVYHMPKASLYLFMRQLQSSCIVSQEKAYIYKEKQEIYKENQTIHFSDLCLDIPSNILCNDFSFYYNEKGNISKAHTIVCEQESNSLKLVFQLGSGRVRLEK
jgi:prepilin-type N-terminal cleavage/methylation domain-containing protein